MNYLTLEEIKDHLSITHSNTAHDARLTRLGTAAEKWAANFLNVELTDLEDSPAESPPVIAEDIKSALLFNIEMEFDRDERKMGLLQKRAEDLLWPYRQGLDT